MFLKRIRRVAAFVLSRSGKERERKRKGIAKPKGKKKGISCGFLVYYDGDKKIN